uniref:C2H2-type domain-containing protein n=3 Tax=Cacopsylla melanoneura TaxID=428564 RepID=A0A8D8Z1A7_9HEMI
MFHCKKCTGSFRSAKLLIDHIRYACSACSLSCPPFFCGEGNCVCYFKSVWSLKRHILSKHSSSEETILSTSSMSQIDPFHLETPVNDADGSVQEYTFEHSVLNFLSQMYRNPQIPRNSVQSITLAVQNLISEYNNILHRSVFENDISFDTVSSNGLMCLKSVNSEYKRFKIFQEQGTLIMPVEITVGTRLDYKHCLGKTLQKQVHCTIQIIPLKDVLMRFFSMKGVLSDTIAHLRRLSNSDSPFTNITQGSVWAQMKNTFNYDPLVLQLPMIVYYDDFESNNPLGSHNVIQKLGGLYVSLPCLPKQYVSLLSNILLFAVFHASDRSTLGNKVVFHNAIEQLNVLQKDGIVVKYNDYDVVLKFRVVCITGDNLGLNGILGFVENFNASYCCRICCASKEERQKYFYEKPELLRTKRTYLDQLSLKESVSITGVKEPCAWLSLKGFDPFENVAVDVLHDYLEGCCRYVMTFVVTYLLHTSSLVRFDILEKRIQSFDFGPDNSSKPVNALCLGTNSKVSVRTSASEMLTLVRYFALIIGDHVPTDDDVWEVFLQLRKVLNLVLTHTVFRDNIPYLENAISELCSGFLTVSKSPLPPKFHFLTHYPRMFLKYGPLTQIWTMRFEAKHKVMKVAARASSNKMNICKTIAIRNQLSLNGLFRDEEPFNFQETGLKRKISTTISLKMKDLFSVSDSFDKTHWSIKWVKINGVLFKEFSVILVDIDVASENPVFAQVINLFVEDSSKKILFYAHQFKTSDFDPHYFAFQVCPTYEPVLVKFDDLYQPAVPHTLSEVQNRLYITSRE